MSPSHSTRALTILEGATGPEHPDVAETLLNYARLYQSQGRFSDAEPMYKRGLAIQEKALCSDHLDVAGSLKYLAELYRALGRYAEAEPLLKRNLAIREKAVGPDHPHKWYIAVAITADRLAFDGTRGTLRCGGSYAYAKV